MITTYDEILSTDDLENLDSFLKAWETVVVLLGTIPAVRRHVDSRDMGARKSECADLRRKLAVAIHESKR